jgi:hypothetical protein
MAAYPYDPDNECSGDHDEEGCWMVLLIGTSCVHEGVIFDDVFQAIGPFSTFRAAKDWCHGHKSTRIVSCVPSTYYVMSDDHLSEADIVTKF